MIFVPATSFFVFIFVFYSGMFNVSISNMNITKLDCCFFGSKADQHWPSISSILTMFNDLKYTEQFFCYNGEVLKDKRSYPHG